MFPPEVVPAGELVELVEIVCAIAACRIPSGCEPPSKYARATLAVNAHATMRAAAAIFVKRPELSIRVSPSREGRVKRLRELYIPRCAA